MLHSRINPYWRESRAAQTYYRKKDQWPVPPRLEPGNFFPVDPNITRLFGDDEDTASPFPGERILLALPNVHFMWPDGAETQGTLRVTAYRLFFVAQNTTLSITHDPSSSKPTTRLPGKRAEPIITTFRHLPYDVVIPMGLIEKIEADPKLKNQRGSNTSCTFVIDCSCKDASEYRFGFGDQDQGERALRLLDSYCFSDYRHIYCFHLPKRTFYSGVGHNPENDGKSAFIDHDYKSIPFRPTSTSLTLPLPDHLDGWRFYNPIQEYERMQIPNSHFRICHVNKDYSLCETYPSILCLPNQEVLNDRDLRSIANFRSKGRIPALVWKNPTGEQTIWRSAQPGSGVTFNRCLEDEKLVHFIGKSNSTNARVTIIDARPKTNAQANTLKGYGFESESNYPFAKVRFMNIENIHDMRTSYRRLTKACARQRYDSSFQTEVIQSLWLKHSADILKATSQIVSLLDIDGSSVLIHCSDGWDRTAQLSSLAKLCVDPYYRTIRGFITLIDHEWLSFGHKFQDRYGHFLREMKDERSPVFLQFLDCVYQLLLQFPRHFEFTSEFLVAIAHHSFTCRFGTFLFNCEKDRMNFRFKPDQLPTRIADVSVSLWTYLLASPKYVQGHFTNALYAPFGAGDPIDLYHEFGELLPQFQPADREVSQVPSSGSLPDGETNVGDSPFLSSPSQISLQPSASPMGDTSAHIDVNINDMAAATTESPILSHISGSVLYPSYSSMKLELWSGFFLRSHVDISNEYYHFNRQITGNIWPGRATSASLLSSQALVNDHLHWSTKLGTTAYYLAQQRQQSIDHLTQQNAILEYQLLQSKRLIYSFEQRFGALPQEEIDQISLEVNMLYQQQAVQYAQHQQHSQYQRQNATAPLFGRIPSHPAPHLLKTRDAVQDPIPEHSHPLAAVSKPLAESAAPPIPSRNRTARATVAQISSQISTLEDVTTTINPLAVLSPVSTSKSGGDVDWTDLLQTNPNEFRQQQQVDHQHAAQEQQQVSFYNAQMTGITSLFKAQQAPMHITIPTGQSGHIPSAVTTPPLRPTLFDMEIKYKQSVEAQSQQQNMQFEADRRSQTQQGTDPSSYPSRGESWLATDSAAQLPSPAGGSGQNIKSLESHLSGPQPRSFSTSFNHNPFDLADIERRRHDAHVKDHPPLDEEDGISPPPVPPIAEEDCHDDDDDDDIDTENNAQVLTSVTQSPLQDEHLNSQDYGESTTSATSRLLLLSGTDDDVEDGFRKLIGDEARDDGSSYKFASQASNLFSSDDDDEGDGDDSELSTNDGKPQRSTRNAKSNLDHFGGQEGRGIFGDDFDEHITDPFGKYQAKPSSIFQDSSDPKHLSTGLHEDAAGESVGPGAGLAPMPIDDPHHYLPEFEIPAMSVVAAPPAMASGNTTTAASRRAPMPIPVNVLGEGEYGDGDSCDEDDE